ncbi:MAG: molecular chaperone HtpG [Pseudomonadota bacterium]
MSKSTAEEKSTGEDTSSTATDGPSDQSSGESLSFQAEVSRLLEIVAKSLYSESEVFLRELISNASDACDRRRYAALTNPDLALSDGEHAVHLSVDKDARTLTVADNGIGMTRDELVDNLGTIARSGTRAFVEQLGSDAKDAASMIGQFGVGFYSAFMVADQVTVLTRKAGETDAFQWQSDGKGGFTIAPAEKDEPGTRITLHLTEGKDEYLSEHTLRTVVRRYSDHIGIPVTWTGEDGTQETLNSASALWTRPKSEIAEEDYKGLFTHLGGMGDPWATLHNRVEGTIEYTSLLFIPETAPFDLYSPEREHRVRLYVRRVFVSEHAEGLVPPYLRFLTGIVDSEDLPLNVSREMLQSTPLVAKIRQGVTKRVLGELKKKAEKDSGAYEGFWTQFGPVLKEGIYEDLTNRDALLDLVRVRTTLNDSWHSIEDYVGRMKEGQEAIYYITGEDLASLERSPQIEGFKAKGIEVMLLTDPVDEFWIPAVETLKDKPVRSVRVGAADLAGVKSEEDEAKDDGESEDKTEASDTAVATLIAVMKTALGETVKDVRSTDRLTDSPVCLVADDGDMDLRLEKLLRAHKQLSQASKRILEINPTHPLIASLADKAHAGGAADQIGDIAHLLYDQARIAEGEMPDDPIAFGQRLSGALGRLVA